MAVNPNKQNPFPASFSKEKTLRSLDQSGGGSDRIDTLKHPTKLGTVAHPGDSMGRWLR